MGEDYYHSKTPVYHLLKNKLIWSAVMQEQISLSQLQKVADVAHDPGILAIILELCQHIHVSQIVNFIEQHGEYVLILKNQQLLGWIRIGIIDLENLNLVKVRLLAMNDGLDVGPVFELADELSEVVEEQALKYLQARASPETAEAFYHFMQVMIRVQKEGVGVIWKHIEDAVANLLFPMFISMYSEDEDACNISPWSSLPCFEETEVTFTELEANPKAKMLEKQAYASYRDRINVGRQAKLGSFNEIQAQVPMSKGYSQYFLRATRPSRPETVFFDMTAKVLYDHRHSSPEAQRAFDQCLGLTVPTNQ